MAIKIAILVFNTVRYSFICYNIQDPFCNQVCMQPMWKLVQLAPANRVARFLSCYGILFCRIEMKYIFNIRWKSVTASYANDQPNERCQYDKFVTTNSDL